MAADCDHFPEQLVKPKMSVEQLMRSTKWTRKVVAARTCRSGQDFIDEEVWKATKEELAQSWLTGILNLVVRLMYYV